MAAIVQGAYKQRMNEEAIDDNVDSVDTDNVMGVVFGVALLTMMYEEEVYWTRTVMKVDRHQNCNDIIVMDYCHRQNYYQDVVTNPLLRWLQPNDSWNAKMVSICVDHYFLSNFDRRTFQNW